MDSIRLRDLEFSYRKDSPELFGGLSYDFEPGKITALTGVSGRGKSTLLYIVGLLLTPRKGDIVFGDRSMTRLNDRELSRFRAKHIGFVFQNAELNPGLRIIDSVCEPGFYAGKSFAEQRGEAEELLTRFGLSEVADHRPGEISGGQAQRVALCRALVNNPVLILADEPTGNLDAANTDLVFDTLESAASEGKTVIIATHEKDVVERAHEVLEL